LELHLLGLNHKTAPVEVREKIAITSAHLKEALKFFYSQNEGQGVILLSTCNRTEIYTTNPNFRKAVNFLENYFLVHPSEFERYFYRYSGLNVLEHLLRVAAGLDSMIVGEGQVLGQVKVAWQSALEVGTANAWLNTAFNRAIFTGKRTRTETSISRGAVSVGAAAVELAKKIFGNLELRQVLIVGAGKMSAAAARLLGSKAIFVANRTFPRACGLAEKVGGRAVGFEQLDDYLKICDIVISSTGSQHYILTRPRIQNAVFERKDPLFLIDIAVPRDIDPKVGELPQIYLYDIDDLNAIAAENLKERQREIPKVESIIEEEKNNFLKWHAGKLSSAPARVISF
jgi:glutamyl-tRNA reductase